MSPILLPVILITTAIAMAVYILKKETNLLGKRFDREYETDITKGLGWAVWSYLWWGGCIISMILSFVRDDWGYSNIFLLWFGTTILFAALVAAWSVIRKERIDAIYSANKIHSPEEIFEAIGAEIKEKKENEDYTLSSYLIAYQGGYFYFAFTENFRAVDICYDAFDKCEFEHLNKALIVANGINLNSTGWLCHISLNENDVLHANLMYRYVLNGSLAQKKDDIKGLLEKAFRVGRDFSGQLKEKINKQQELDKEFFNDKDFQNKIAYMQRQNEMKHLDGKQHDEYKASSELFVHNLIVKYFDNADFGCLQSMKIINGEQVECITEINKIEIFDVREYIRRQPDAASVEGLSLIFNFEYQDLFVHLTKTKGSTDKSLFFIVNITRSGSELDGFMDNRFPYSYRTLMEVRLVDAEKDYWEAKYMIDDAIEKSESGRTNELTDEQELVLAHIQPNIQLDLYWGKKFFINNCYFQALYHFNRIFEFLKSRCNEWDKDAHSLYVTVSYYIGFIYNDLKMYDRAFYYLWIAQAEGMPNAIQEFTNCLCNMKEVSAKDYIKNVANDVSKVIEKDEEEFERLLPMHNFLRRRYVYVLVDRGELDEAEEILNKMISDAVDVDFAEGELKCIKELRKKKQ